MTMARLKMHIPAAIFAVGFVAPLMWMVMDRELPYVRTAGHIVPANPRPGDEIEIHWDLKVNKACPVSAEHNITRTVVTSAGRVIEYDPVKGEIGGSRSELKRTAVSRKFRLPAVVEPGPAKYRSSACFACNPLQHFLNIPVCVTEPEVNFTIGEPDGG